MLTFSPIQYISKEQIEKDSDAEGNSSDAQRAPQIYEQMLRTAATNPNQIYQIGEIIDKLGSDTVPQEFRVIFKQFKNAIK